MLWEACTLRELNSERREVWLQWKHNFLKRLPSSRFAGAQYMKRCTLSGNLRLMLFLYVKKWNYVVKFLKTTSSPSRLILNSGKYFLSSKLHLSDTKRLPLHWEEVSSFHISTLLNIGLSLMNGAVAKSCSVETEFSIRGEKLSMLGR